MISLTLPSFKQLITHRHTITAFTAQSSLDMGGERKTEGGERVRDNLQQTRGGKKKRESAEDILRKKTEHGKESEREKGKRVEASLLLSLQQVFCLSVS